MNLKEEILSNERKKGHGVLKDGPTAELIELTINRTLEEVEKMIDNYKWIEQEPLKANTIRHIERHLTAVHNNQLNELKTKLQELKNGK